MLELVRSFIHIWNDLLRLSFVVVLLLGIQWHALHHHMSIVHLTVINISILMNISVNPRVDLLTTISCTGGMHLTVLPRSTNVGIALLILIVDQS